LQGEWSGQAIDAPQGIHEMSRANDRLLYGFMGMGWDEVTDARKGAYDFKGV